MKILLLLFFFGVTCIAQAQDSVRHSTVNVNFGVAGVYNHDEFQAPYTYKGLNYLVGLGYTYATPRHRHELALSVASGRIKSDVSPNAGSQLIWLSYDYFARTRSLGSRFTVAGGIGLHALANRVNYLPDVELPKTYLSGGVYLALNARVQYLLSNRSHLEFQGSLSTVGILYRPDFEANGSTLTKAVVIGQSLLSSVKLEYVHALKPRLYLTVSYQNIFFNCRDPRPATIVQQGLALGLRKTF